MPYGDAAWLAGKLELPVDFVGFSKSIDLDEIVPRAEEYVANGGGGNGGALLFDRQGGSLSIPTLWYAGDHPITLEFRGWGNGAVVGNWQGSGLGLEIFDDKASFRLHDGHSYRKLGGDLGAAKIVHVAGTFDGKSIQLFVNGKLQATESIQRSHRPSLLAFMVGANPQRNPPRRAVWPPTLFRGVISEVRISDCVRYAEDFEPEPRLRADSKTMVLYHLSQGEGSIVVDASGNHHHGQIWHVRWTDSPAGFVKSRSKKVEALRRPAFENPDAQHGMRLLPGYSADEFYRDIPNPDGITERADGSLLVVNEAEPMGVFIARKGKSFDVSHAFSTVGSPFVGADDIFLHPDGHVFVSDIQLNALLMIDSKGGAPTVVVSNETLRKGGFAPQGITIAPATFDGPNVDPGDLIVADSGTGRNDRWAVWAINPVTGAAKALAQGKAFVDHGPSQVAFGPDGRLFVYENRDWGVTRIVTLDSSGTVHPFVAGIPDKGGLAVHPTTGHVYFGLQDKLREIWRVSRDGGSPEVFASGFRGRIQDLTFSSDGQKLFVADEGRVLEITGPFLEDGE